MLRSEETSFPLTSKWRCSSSFSLDLYQTTQSFNLIIFFNHCVCSDSNKLSHTTMVGPPSPPRTLGLPVQPTERNRGLTLLKDRMGWHYRIAFESLGFIDLLQCSQHWPCWWSIPCFFLFLRALDFLLDDSVQLLFSVQPSVSQKKLTGSTFVRLHACSEALHSRLGGWVEFIKRQQQQL